MSIRKRLRILWAAATQTWHEKQCAECGNKYWAVGPATDLIAICDRCEVEEMDRFMTSMERQYQDTMRGARH